MTGVVLSHVQQHMEFLVSFWVFNLSQTLKLNMAFLMILQEFKDQHTP